MRVGRITVSDRASAGVYEDRSGPALDVVLQVQLPAPVELQTQVLPDDLVRLTAALLEFADQQQLDLVVTTGGTGPGPRDITPEATRAVVEKELPGFGEAMRLIDFPQIPTSILSRGLAGTRGRTLIVNLPGKPRAAVECLERLLPAIREAVLLLHGEDPHEATECGCAHHSAEH